MDIADYLVLYSQTLAFRKLENFYVVLNIDEPNIVAVDEPGVELLKLCDGKHTIKSIVEHIQRKYPSGENDYEKVAGFIASLINAGFVSTSEDPHHKGVQRSEKLKVLYLHLTHECNLRCKHCYVDAGLPLRDELKTDEISTLLRDFLSLGGDILVLTGGEPLLRRKALDSAISEADALGISYINLETNGTLITKEDADFYKKHDVKVSVSLGGATPQSHSYVRGTGSFENALNGIRTLTQAGVKTRVGVTLTSSNLRDAEEAVYLIKELGADSVVFNMVVMMGRANENPELRISPKDAMIAIKESRKAAEKVKIETVFEEILSDKSRLPRKNMCGAGVALLSITADGDVYPCNSFHGGSFKVGNIREHNLKDIYEHSTVLQTFKKLDAADVSDCRDCDLKFICGCGCLAETFRAYGSLTRRSPYCDLYKEVYWSLITELGQKLWSQT